MWALAPEENFTRSRQLFVRWQLVKDVSVETLCPCSRFRAGFWFLLWVGQLPTAAYPAEGPPVASRIIVSDQTAPLRDSQHGSAEVHVHRIRRAHQRLILILVNQRDALRVADLNHRGATASDGC